MLSKTDLEIKVVILVKLFTGFRYIFVSMHMCLHVFLFFYNAFLSPISAEGAAQVKDSFLKNTWVNASEIEVWF